LNYVPKLIYTHPVDGSTTITLTLPPEGDFFPEDKLGVGKLSKSNNGTKQFQYNYTEERNKIQLTFLTETEITALRKLYEDHALKGGSFDYYESEDEVTFITVTLRDKKFNPRRLVKETTGFIYDLVLDIERTI
jgi:hypothetical protein